MGTVRGKHTEVLLMRIPIKVRLMTRLHEVKNEMENYPNYKLGRIGTILKYQIVGTKKAGIDYRVELGRSHIILEIGSVDSPLYEMRNSLNILIGTCAILKDHYEVDFGSLYPYLAYELNKEQVDYYDKQFQQFRKENYSDIILARRINELLRKRNSLTNKVSALESDFGGLIAKILVFEGLHRTTSISEIGSKYSLSKEQVDSGIDCLTKNGYRIRKNSKDKFSVVAI